MSRTSENFDFFDRNFDLQVALERLELAGLVEILLERNTLWQ